MHVRLDELRGRKVFDANGREIGRVKAALVDMDTWLVDTLRIGVAMSLGLSPAVATW